MRRRCAVLLGTLTTAAFLCGQTPTGTIQGTVQDTSEAAVPEARVVITNGATNESRELRTDGTGRYLQPFLLAGTYTIVVEKEGFRSVKQENIKVDVGQNRSVNFVLELGALAQQIQVEAAPPPLDTNTSVVGQVIENKRIMDLPLNGRSAFSLAGLTPGVNTTGGGSTPMMGGGRNATSELQIDGVTDLGVENNPGITQRIYEPQVDAVQEFSSQVNAISAEYGRFGGGVINVATRSGTNTLHGTAYDYLRNSKMDANAFFANRAGRPKAGFKRNQWGYTVGGPIYIPGVYDGRDKTFFFTGLETTNSRSLSVYTGTVPLNSWRAGDLSDLRTVSGAVITVYDPLTVRPDPANPGKYIRDTFPGNRIPADRLNPVARKVLSFYPQPNVTPINPYTQVNNYTNSGVAPSDSSRMDTRVDHNWKANWRMFARVSVAWGKSSPFRSFNNIADGATTGNSGARSVSIDHTVTLSPTLVLNLRYGLGRYTSRSVPVSDGFDLTQLGLPASMNPIASMQNAQQFPAFDFGGTAVLASAGAMSSIGITGWSRARYADLVHSFSGSVTKILSRHSIKTGGEMRKFLLNYSQPGYPAGYFSFTSAWTQAEIATPSVTAGSPLGSFLLGLPGSGQVTHDPVPAAASWYFAGYVQDDIKITRRLTLNLGIRYELDTPRTIRTNDLSYYRMYDPSPIAGKVPSNACPACGNLMGAMYYTDATHRQQVTADKNNFGPRVGLAYDLGWKAVMRAGYGMAYAPNPLQAAGVSGNLGLNGFRTTTNLNSTFDSMRTIAATLSNPFPDGFNLPPGRAGGPANQLGLSVSESVFPTNVNPQIHEWNMNVQREMPGNMVVEIAYIGQRGLHLVDGDGGLSYNQLPDSYMKYGSSLLNIVPNPFYGIITNATSGLSKPTVQWSQLQRPYPHMSGVSEGRQAMADSIYHAMTIRVDKRFAQGVSFLMAYTAGKLIDDSSNSVLFLGPVNSSRLDNYNWRLDRAVSSLDVAQRAVFSYVWELPFGKGRRFLTGLPKLPNMLVTGWQINGITTLQSGTPLIIFPLSNNSGIYAGQRANNNGKSAHISGGSKDQRIGQWFDTSVFSQPASYTFGNAGRTLPDARNPGTRSTDLSMFKNSYFGPEKRINLQYRLEAFNVFNTTQFSGPGTTLGSANFGVISGTAVSPRQVQMALKLIW